MTHADPRFLRTTFEAAPELYDRMRPVAPPELFDDLVELAGLRPDDRVLELGCGTGQATLPLAERSLEVVGVELGAGLAELARKKLAGFPRVRIVTSSFEGWDAAGDRFDAVVCVNAFHWIEPDVRYVKPAALLKPGGSLAVVAMRWTMPDDADPGWASLQEDYDAVLGATGLAEAPVHPDLVRTRASEIEASGLFGHVQVRRYRLDVAYDADEYLALLSTSSWHRTLDEGDCRELFERLHRRIEALPDGRIRPTLIATLDVARKL
jgi:SAM-dependent methyltransferase